jgi:hypothetical protein
MRVPIAILVAAGLLGCVQDQPRQMMASASAPAPASGGFAAPPPVPPTQRAPICARPQEKQAVAVSALMTELQVISIICHTDEKYNSMVLRMRPDLMTNVRALDAFFVRAYGSRGQQMHDEYITDLANSQSEQGLRSGDQFCALNAGMLDEVGALKGGTDLAAYAATKPIQQGLLVEDCAAKP